MDTHDIDERKAPTLPTAEPFDECPGGCGLSLGGHVHESNGAYIAVWHCCDCDVTWLAVVNVGECDVPIIPMAWAARLAGTLTRLYRIHVQHPITHDNAEHEDPRPEFDRYAYPVEMDVETWARFVLDQIEHVVKHGLHPVYDDEWDFLCDVLIGDLPWTEPLATTVPEAIIASPRFVPLNIQFIERFGCQWWEE